MKNPLNQINKNVERISSKIAVKSVSKSKIILNKIKFSLFLRENAYDKQFDLTVNQSFQKEKIISIISKKESQFFIEIITDDSKILGRISFNCIENESCNQRFILIENIFLIDIAIGVSESEENIYLSDSLFSNETRSFSSKDDNRLFTIKEVLTQKFSSFDAVFIELYEEFNEKKSVEHFLHKIDAKFVPLKNYGSLIEANSQVKLINFPRLNDNIFLIKQEILASFLSMRGAKIDNKITCYSKGSRIEQNKIIEENIKLSNLEGEFVYLKQVSLPENPILNCNRVSICLEILIDEDYIDEQIIFPNYGRVENKNRINEDDNYYLFERNEKYKNTSVTEIIKSFIGKKGYCTFTHSYETDLLSYKYQDLPPFYTKNYNSKKFKIKFANKINFISEGRKEQFYNEENNKTVEVQGYINYTYFFNSHLRVWHIVITPTETSYLNELQIIQISKYFAGLQEAKAKEDENEGQKDYVSFEFDNHTIANIDELFEYLTEIKYQWKNAKYNHSPLKKYLPSWLKIQKSFNKSDIYNTDATNISAIKQKKLLTSGIIAVDMNYTKYLQVSNEKRIKEEVENKFEEIYTIINKREGDLKTQNTDVENVFKALCGITLGIFDFGRMGVEEISDTLSPREKSITPSSFLTINRGVLTSYAFDDDVYNSCHKTLGINPYLMIPSAVLAHNDFVSRDAEKRLNRAWELSSEDLNEKVSMGEIIVERNYIDDLINDDVLPNVFQYPTEQELYSYGMKHRGITERIEEIRAKLIQLDKIIEQKQIQKNQKSEKTIQLILTFLSLLQVASFSLDFAGLREYSFKWSNVADFVYHPIQSQHLNIIQKGVLSFAILVFGIILYIIWRNSPFRISKKTKNEKFNSY